MNIVDAELIPELNVLITAPNKAANITIERVKTVEDSYMSSSNVFIYENKIERWKKQLFSFLALKVCVGKKINGLFTSWLFSLC